MVGSLSLVRRSLAEFIQVMSLWIQLAGNPFATNLKETTIIDMQSLSLDSWRRQSLSNLREQKSHYASGQRLCCSSIEHAIKNNTQAKNKFMRDQSSLSTVEVRDGYSVLEKSFREMNDDFYLCKAFGL